MCMRWINENAAPFCHAISSGEAASYLQAKARDDTTDEDSFDSFWAPPNLAIFEVGGLLQNLMDVLSSAAATLGIELVLYHGQDPTYEQPQPGEFRPESGLRELHCKGDDAGLGAAIIAVKSDPPPLLYRS